MKDGDEIPGWGCLNEIRKFSQYERETEDYLESLLVGEDRLSERGQREGK